MKKNKKLILLLACIAACISLFFIINIYAKYLTSANGSTSIPISRWNILVNNLSIRDNADISSVITPIFPGNENISSNIIAPTSEGYFDLNFDFTNVDVSFKYDISTSVNQNSAVQDLVATGYSIDNGETVAFANSTERLSDTIHLNDNIPNRNIRIYVKWIDDETSNMDNAADTISTTGNNPAALFDVNISFTQVVENT